MLQLNTTPTQSKADYFVSGMLLCPIRCRKIKRGKNTGLDKCSQGAHQLRRRAIRNLFLVKKKMYKTKEKHNF